MLNIILQGIISLFLVFIMGFIAYSIYNNEYVKNIGNAIMNGNKKTIPIFTGRFEFSNTQVNIETYNPNNLGYLNINPSRNQQGGAEYSYNFWLLYHLNENSQKINTTLNNTDYIILFFKGANIKTMKYNSLKYNSLKYDCSESGDKKLLIKNPLVKLRNDGKEILVEYNNINFPDTFNQNAKPINCDDLIDSVTKTRRDSNNVDNNNKISQNKFGIKDMKTEYYNDKFNMITLVFQENPSNEEVFNNYNANYRIYLNGELVEDRLANTNNLENNTDDTYNFKSRVIKNNNSKLNINPLSYDNIVYDETNPEKYINKTMRYATLPDNITRLQPLQMADFTYFNYALSTNEINALYRKGYHTELANIKSNLSLSKYDYAAKYINNPTPDLSKPI